MLHLACLSRNLDAMQFLINANITPNLRDRNGCTADQVCFCPQMKKQLPPRYLVHKEANAREPAMRLKPSLQDKDTIFSLARNPKFYTEIQKKLQMFDFNVNTECDSNGDFLLHIAVKGGLTHLPSIMSLMKIQTADVELCNADGMTALMLAAAAGNCVLCDVLICLFGADANKQNPNIGRSALHYAVEGNHRKTVECLVRRGADVNIEDHDGRRPDDIPSYNGSEDDCKEVISFNRSKRLEALSDQVRKGDVEMTLLYVTDLYVVDEDGYTLLMIAVIYNRADTLAILLAKNRSTINAQHTKTGMTALSIAAQMGNDAIVEILLEQGANPGIADMDGYLPLHHAILNNQEMVLDVFLHFFPDTFIGLYKAQRLCKKSSIHKKLQLAWERRQEEIVNPKVLDCSLNGKASELYCMLDDGDSINLRSGSGNWPLYLAVENGNLDVVKLLFEKGGDIRKRHSTTGSTVLHLASKMGHFAIVEFLTRFCRPSGEITKMRQKGQSCRRILDINVVDAENKTALQLAAEKGFIKVANLLLQCGATTAILDANGCLFTCPEFEGLRIMIDAERDQHTKLIAKCITDKSKKAFNTLQEAWLPRFDHNLRTKEGDTALMLACRCGRLPVVKFLLESAVYPEVLEEDHCADYSDGDSGVLDPSGLMIRNKPRSHVEDDFQTSCNLSQSVEVDDLTRSVEVRDRPMSPSPDKLDGTLRTLLKDVVRPKGLAIYQSGYVSHISAVNLYDGCTPLHRAVQGADNHSVVRALLKLDNFCLNSQNDAGLSALHLACSLGRKKVIDVLLAQEGIDLNVRTLDGHLPEEMTTSKNIIKKVQKARLNNSSHVSQSVSQESPVTPSDSISASVAGTTVNFDQVQHRYEALKQEVKTGTTN
ncbi:ankyrin-3-like isoform X2 [Gigantopelta aegis]|nr:ankyrin-3-like isoform X2 [Gigantopelta aegis]XP_041374462.1 ankyrin-3-like isoform X2 [Gigantopelta aegis]